jgi:hypothetical protein
VMPWKRNLCGVGNFGLCIWNAAGQCRALSTPFGLKVICCWNKDNSLLLAAAGDIGLVCWNQEGNFHLSWKWRPGKVQKELIDMVTWTDNICALLQVQNSPSTRKLLIYNKHGALLRSVDDLGIQCMVSNEDRFYTVTQSGKLEQWQTRRFTRTVVGEALGTKCLGVYNERVCCGQPMTVRIFGILSLQEMCVRCIKLNPLDFPPTLGARWMHTVPLVLLGKLLDDFDPEEYQVKINNQRQTEASQQGSKSKKKKNKQRRARRNNPK